MPKNETAEEAKSNFRRDHMRDRGPRLLAAWMSVWLTASAVLGTPAFGGPQSATVDLSSFPIHLRNPSDAKAVITRIDHDTAAIAAKLSPNGRKAYLASIQRLHAFASAHCGFYPGQKALEAGEETCLLNIYDNFILSIPGSVYQVGQWRVYETGVYGIELADDSLLNEDPDRPFWWDLELTWPRVDAESSPIPSAAQYALAELTGGAGNNPVVTRFS